MTTGRSFHAIFADKASADMYFTLSAAQMIVYNAKVQEENYFYWFAR